MDAEFSILTPNAMLGNGYRLDHFWYGIHKYKPAAIIVDSGSTDGGPYKLGLSKLSSGRGAYLRDLEPMLTACYHLKVKVLIGSVGGDGSNKHVQEMLDIVTEVSNKNGFSFKVATIDAGLNRGLIKTRIRNAKVGPCGPVEPLTEHAVDNAVDIVAQMGAEPYLEALKSDPDIILGGRAYDPAPFAAFCMKRNVLPGVAWHMGKILECGGICALPKGRSIIAVMRHDSFDLTPLAPEERCTPLSVASHTLYEKTRPDQLPGPGGVLWLDEARYEQVTEKTTRVQGAKFVPTPVYQVKLEGVEHLGYRTLIIGGIRDPILISQIDDFLDRVRKYSQNLYPELDESEQCRLIFHVYGRNGTMGPLEPTPVAAHEIGLMGEVVAPTQELSHVIMTSVRASLLHMSYPGQLATTGNYAFPLSPHEVELGPVFKFSLYHLVDLEAGEEKSLFPVTIHSIDTSGPITSLTNMSDKEIEEYEARPLATLTQKPIPTGLAKMADIAKIIRSKNSGPFEVTFDIMFDSPKAYWRVQNANVLGNDTVRRLYHVKDEDIITNMFFEPALAWKCTLKRLWVQGSVGERDTLATQQHAPLLGILVPPAQAASIGNGAVQNVNGVSTSLAPPRADRTSFTTLDSVKYIWMELGLPAFCPPEISLPGKGNGLPSSFKVGHIAQMTIALSAMTASLIHSGRNKTALAKVTVPLDHACVEFKSERLYTLNGNPRPLDPKRVGGTYKTSDGYALFHDAFPNHRHGALKLLGLPETASRDNVAAEMKEWTSIDLETAAYSNNLVIGALRSLKQWDVTPQARAIPDCPVSLRHVQTGAPAGWSPRMNPGASKCLSGLRVLELSRVIATPVAGKTLAAHGADVIWITSPNLPDLPDLDRDLARGKRSVHLDLNRAKDKVKLLELAKDADVFIQGFRPGSLAAKGFGRDELRKVNPRLVYANMSAFGTEGPWAARRGYDSILQTVSGMDVSEAEHFGKGEATRSTPCQTLDHGAGYLVATGVMAAVYKTATEGGAWDVDVSLSGVMQYLRSLGQLEGRTGFDGERDYERNADVPEEWIAERESGFGLLRAVAHSAEIEGVTIEWDRMPVPLGSDEAEWL